ncbi:MAG: hypothetical protein V1708_01335 [Candidatus Micrarchaeota archaeon]
MKYLKARRGQAFETMMLVISVIVALAILAVLLNILNIVKIFNPSSPKDVMSSGLKEIQSKGYGITSPQKVSFTKGQVFTVGEIVADIPVQRTDVKFICEDTAVCKGTNPLSTDDTNADNRLTVKDKVDAYVVTCGNEGSTPRYCVSVAYTQDAATRYCIAASPGGCNV